MSFLLRLCLGLVILAPALAHARSLLSIFRVQGDKLSGIGLISGWKCEADGDITINSILRTPMDPQCPWGPSFP